MASDFLVSALVTLFVTVDPIGLVPIFLALTHGLPTRTRQHIALRAAIITAAILTGAALIGDWLLKTLGITLPAFRIAGGLLLFAVAAEMVLGVRTERQSKQAEQALEDHVRNLAAFPLAIPLMAGPGAITATVLLAGQTQGRLPLLALLIAIVVVIVTVCFGVFVFASHIARLLGTTGNVVLSRLLGVLLAALAVQFIIDGIRSVLAGGM